MAGGTNGFSSFNTTQLYDPTNGIWNYTASLNIRRFDHTATLLPNGKVLAVGATPTAVSLTARSCTVLLLLRASSPAR